MAPIWCGQFLLPLFLWVMTCSQVSSEACDVPSRIDQQFCTSFYSICLSTPNKKCLAESASQCIDDVGFPIDVIASLKNFITRFIWETNQSKPATPSATPTPHHMLFPPTPSRRPSPVPVEVDNEYFRYLLLLLESLQEQQIQTVVRLTLEENHPPAHVLVEGSTKIVDVDSVVQRLLYLLQSYSYYQIDATYLENYLKELLESSVELYDWIALVLDNIYTTIEIEPQLAINNGGSIAKNYNIGQYDVLIDPMYSTTYHKGPFVSTDQSYVTMPPMIRPPTTLPPTPAPVEVDNEYFRYLFLLLESLQEQKIQNVVRLTLEENHPPAHVLVDGSTQIVDVDSVVRRLLYLVQKYSYHEIDAIYLESYLKELLESSVELYDWIALVLDNIYTTLEIEPELTINYGGSHGSLRPYDGSNDQPYSEIYIPRPYDGSTDQSYTSEIPAYNSGSYDEYFDVQDEDPAEWFGNWFYNVFSTTQSQRLSLGYCHGNVPHSADCEKYCTNDYGGNWIAVQTHERSQNSRVFDTYFDDYARGFGSLETGYWMGLECLTAVTQTKPHELLIELTDAMGNTAIAHYEYFSVGDAQSGYELHLGKYKGGAAGDSLRISDGMKFTAKDLDFDGYRGNCAVKHDGGWWYYNCQKFGIKNFLNGDFSSDENVKWTTWETSYSICATRVFIREIDFYWG